MIQVNSIFSMYDNDNDMEVHVHTYMHLHNKYKCTMDQELYIE